MVAQPSSFFFPFVLLLPLLPLVATPNSYKNKGPKTKKTSEKPVTANQKNEDKSKMFSSYQELPRAQAPLQTSWCCAEPYLVPDRGSSALTSVHRSFLQVQAQGRHKSALAIRRSKPLLLVPMSQWYKLQAQE